MCKINLINKILHLKISTALLSTIWFISLIQMFGYYGSYDYSHIPANDIERLLFRKINPNLASTPTRPKCTYDFMTNSETMFGKSMPTEFNDFEPSGIVNGSFSPKHCNPIFSVAILVTYRNRQKQLDTFLPYMHDFLRKQNIHYKIFVIEQQDEKPWNKGALYNIGAKYALAENFPCLIFHDVDLLPLDQSNLYACLSQPRHMSASIDRLRYVLPYSYLVGGALAMQATQYVLVNGFSNKFLDWGGEDDDLAFRMDTQKLHILRFPMKMSRYAMLRHHKQKKNNDRFKVIVESRSLFMQDGLNTVKYFSVNVKRYRLFTLIGVKL